MRTHFRAFAYLSRYFHQKPEEAEGSAGKNSSDWIVPDLAGKEKPGVELRRAHQSEGLKLSHFSHTSFHMYLYILDNHDL